MSFTRTFTSYGQTNSSDFVIKYSPPCDLLPGYEYEVAPRHICTFMSWYNIGPNAGPNGSANNVFRYYNGTAWKTATLPSGSYSVDSLNIVIQLILESNGDYTLSSGGVPEFDINFDVQIENGYTQMVLLNSYQVDFSVAGAPYKFFGFSNIIYTSSATAPNPADVTGGVTSLLLHCDLIKDSYINERRSDVLFSLASTSVAPLGVIDILVPSENWVPINARDQLHSVRFWWSDDTGKPLSLNGAPVNIHLEFRPIVGIRRHAAH